ncbi:aromatic-ring-hydroxylating dioxygenase subunit beta [Pandoraea fibrosis]|uniref:Aromatic-ring-hydroxylating dioxygenase subunit beta n=1 Tax=Pandoraea fibrosis TaxID=1891094 RepID=A0ABX6HVI2_9BURK|nr:aromatic-ring-hydroxylating dioxygenase subunit beta [Pandoraea fibrosis]QHE91521.1 aromatic-ring-hydroxylating dioxygenase subunit beta [Pandoraea fibrosis]QHF14921.1 aromatic-ring-hydroxylating dioxygenase subunit beta [Pandoraea fibrosis]
MSNVISNPTDADATHRPLLRQDYEDFLFQEAALLDEWRLDEWFALFEAGATYEVPTAGALDEADSHDSLFYIADDYTRLGYRIERLKKTGAHSEFPRSICTRLISNVRVLGTTEQGVAVGCKFVTYRSKDNVTHIFFGHHRYVLVNDGGAIRIVSKRSHLDMSSLRPQGRVSIIL